MTQDEIIEMAIQGHASTRDAIRWAMNQEREQSEPVAWNLKDVTDAYKLGAKSQQRTWVGLMRGVRVEGNAVVITVKGGNDEARCLCGELINEMEMRKEKNT